MELDSSLHQLSMRLVDVIHQEADMVNASRIQAQLKGLAGNGFILHRPNEIGNYREGEQPFR